MEGEDKRVKVQGHPQVDSPFETIKKKNKSKSHLGRVIRLFSDGSFCFGLSTMLVTDL